MCSVIHKGSPGTFIFLPNTKERIANKINTTKQILAAASNDPVTNPPPNTIADKIANTKNTSA